MSRYIRTILFSLMILVSGFLFGQDTGIEVSLKWRGLIEESQPSGAVLKYLYFDNADIDPQTNLPVYSYTVNFFDLENNFTSTINRLEFAPCTPDETLFLDKLAYSKTNIETLEEIYFERGKPYGLLKFVPIVFNANENRYEKVVRFSLDIESYNDPTRTPGSSRTYAENSVLATGDWFKFKIPESGIYKLDYNDLANAGVNVDDINPNLFRMFGNGGGMLPEANSTSRYDDLQEIAISVVGEEDGNFDPGDYILFYGMSPHTWSEVLGVFLYQINYYDNHNYYYFTPESLNIPDSLAPKRIVMDSMTSSTPTNIVETYNNYKVIEEDKINLIKSGKKWYGDEFGEMLTKTYDFNFPSIVEGEEVVVKFSTVNRTFENDHLVVNINQELYDTITLTSVDPNSTKFAQKKKKTLYYTASGPNVAVTLEYIPAATSSRCWLDYINVNVRSSLILSQDQLAFRDLESLGDGAISNFKVDGTNASTVIWEITDWLNPRFIESFHDDGITDFIVQTYHLREFIATNGSSYFTPEFVGKVENQNLHGSVSVDYVILTHPDFREAAERLAVLHDNINEFNILITEPEKVYNEFSSGKQDPTAIRDFMKMLYDDTLGSPPKYLLLFGDGSFDPKDRIEHNTNYIPTFQTEESLISASSYVVDDYFGLLDDDEGEDAHGVLDIGIGRLPVKDTAEAYDVIDKIYAYVFNKANTFGKWRNSIYIIADDEDGNLHLDQADSVATFIPELYNQHKIYLDAHEQIKTPSGDKYPDVNEKLNQMIQDGGLIVNYIGHGGTGGWAHERILQQADINNWSNFNKLPVFVTATCEFSRFDEPEVVSGGELMILNENGGGIGLFTTTRLAYSQSNFRLNLRLFERAFGDENGELPYFGDLIRISKPPNQLNTRNFILLGDPALQMAYPMYRIQIDSINGEEVQENNTDTINALQKVHLSGSVIQSTGQRFSEFSGFIQTALYDKPTQYTTFGNDPGSFPVEFINRDKIVWNGLDSVTNGRFEISFVVPKDIALNYGTGKISFYAQSDEYDAHGSFTDFELGGTNQNAASDNTGPDIQLFLNDFSFSSGDITHPDPLLIGILQDEHGINVSDNGIGHSITAILDNDYSNVIELNDYYQPELNNYQGGSINFQFQDLEDGEHILTLKAWDSYNNSNSASIRFVIKRNAELDLFEVKNYPNPFSNHTTFTFKHTRPGNELNIKLELFDLFGKFVYYHETTLFSDVTDLPFFEWDGSDTNGSKVGSGVYLYIVTVSDEAGNVAVRRQKLVISAE